MNEEYFSYIEKLKEINFEQNLIFLEKKYKNKKVLLYAAGLFFDAIADNYNLKKHLNIVGICDIKFQENKPETYKEIKTFEPNEIKSLDIDIVLACNLSPNTIKNTIRKNRYIKENIKIEYIIQENFKNILSNELEKLNWASKLLLKGENILKTLKYWKTCNKQELKTKLNYKKVLNRIKKTSTPLKVMFIVEENAKWGWQTIYDEMKKDIKNFEILPIIALPAGFVQYEYTQQETIDFFKKRNMPAINGYDTNTGKSINLKDFKADFVMYQQPTCIKDYYSPEFLSEQSLCCIIPYGYSSLEEKSWGSDLIKTKLANMWKMFVESNYHKYYTEKAAKLKNKDIVKVTGYPKLDAYKQPISCEVMKLWKEESRESKGRIIYAPHHTIENHRHEMSNFKEQYLFFLELAKANPHYSFIYKPHPLLRSKCIYENFLTAEEYDEYEKSWNELPNASSYNQGEYFDIFKTSNLLITDCSSFLGEYFASEKPIIFLDRANRAGFNEFGELMKKTFYIPKTTEEIPNLIDELLLKKNDTTKEERLKIIEQEYYLPKDGIGVHIVKYLKKISNRN